MKRRSTVSGQNLKPQGQAARKFKPSLARQEEEIVRLTRELEEARERQTATSKVLRALSQSDFQLQSVLQSVAESAARLCRSDGAVIFQLQDGVYRFAAGYSLLPEFLEIEQRALISPGPGTLIGRAAMTRNVARIDDALIDPLYEKKEDAKVEGNRSMIGVPLMRGGEPVVVIGMGRRRVDPFGEHEIELVKSFAAQAVIAIENARLLNELRQRTTDLTEALEQQTATAEVLQVIGGSPGDLQPVFETMLANATRICEAKFGVLWLSEGECFRCVALHNAPLSFADHYRDELLVNPPPGSGLRRLFETRQVAQVTDMTTIRPYIERDPFVVASVELGGYRSVLNVPMLKEGALVGAISIFRQEVLSFTDKQIELVKNFAAQAVIAIENARLLNELRQRTTDLTEALEQQTASAEVLQVISSSAGDLEPVFATMLRKAVSICDARFGTLYFREGDRLRLIATHQVPPAFAEAQGRAPFRPVPDGMLDAVMKTGKTVHLADLAQAQSYSERDPRIVEAVEIGGIRSVVGVPLIKDDELMGLIGIYRQEVRPFAAKQIDLLTNFAAQAVVAIENARLLNELRQRTTELTGRTTDLAEALEQQSATSAVLGAISSSRGDLEPVFRCLLQNATSVCHASFGNLALCEGDGFRNVAIHNAEPVVDEFFRGQLIHPHPESPLSLAAKTKRPSRVDDLRKTAPYFAGNEGIVMLADVGGARAFLCVPMLKQSLLMGVIILYRSEVQPFTDKQIDLVEHFAAQAVIAIENARLLNELRQRTDEVEKLNRHLEQRVTDQVDEIERMSRLRRFLPPQVADLIVASGSEKQLESHRREITALFCDLRGFTGFTESADAEDVMALLRDYHAAIGDIIIKYNGTLERYAGDGIMVIFNDPVPVENPALQAVLMALEVREAIGRLTETWRRWGHELGFGIGIAHGFATLGTIGFEGRFDYAAIGTVSNVASRLCDEAKPGQILISPRVLTKVENAVQVEPVGEFELKGIRRPMAAYNVVAART